MKEIIQIGKYIFIIFLVWSHFFSSPIVYSQNLTPDEEYQFIIEKIKNREDTDVDYTSLRMLYTQTSWYKADSKERDENILKMAQAWVDQRYDEAIQLGNRLLEEEYLNPFVHDLFAKIYKETGSEEMIFHLMMFINITSSIGESGDGKGFETAYKVISTWEEKGMMTLMQVTPVEQVIEPTTLDGHYYHVVQVGADETGERSSLYFNIDIPFQKTQQTGPLMTTPDITPPPTPTLQSINAYTDPSGQFSISFPAGFFLLPSQPNLIQCSTPDNGILYIIIANYTDTMRAFYDEITKRPGSLSGESQFQAGTLSGKIQVYTMSGSFQVLDGKSYAVLLITYSGIDYGLVVVIPVESYPNAQGWLSTLVTGVQYQPASTLPPTVGTPTLPPALPITPSLEFTAPDESFRVSLPAGVRKGGEWPNIAEYLTPNQGTLYILSGDATGTLNLFHQDLAQKQGKMLGQPVLFQTHEGVQGKMEVNTMVGSFQTADGKDYVSFLVSYEQPECALVVIVPIHFYNEAQDWISSLIIGVTFQGAQPTSSPFFTPMPTTTSMLSPQENTISIPTPLPSETLPPLTGW